MFRTFGRSWQLVKMSWELLMRDRELLTFPLLSMIGCLVISILFGILSLIIGIPQALAEETANSGTSVMGVVLTFFYFFALYIVVVYTKVAITGAVLIRLEGGNPTVNDGFQIASGLLGVIIPFAAVNAVVSLLTSMIRGNSRNSDNFVYAIIGSILAGIIDAAWSVATYLAIPVIVVEKVDAMEAIKRSGSLVRDTWGRQIAGSVSMGAVFGLISVVVFFVSLPLLVIAFNSGSIALGLFMIALLVLVFVGISLVSAALDSIYRLALYRYAHDQKVEVYDEAVLRGAFVPA
jgi:hypothetical protein